MSAALRSTHGVAHYEPGRTFDGHTLFALMSGRNVWLINMWGVIVHRWRVENLPGNCGQTVELDWYGNPVWEYLNPFYHEHPIFGTSNLVFRCICNGASHPGICDADLDSDRYGDFNTLVPKRPVRSPRANQRLRARYEVGEVVHGGH